MLTEIFIENWNTGQILKNWKIRDILPILSKYTIEKIRKTVENQLSEAEVGFPENQRNVR